MATRQSIPHHALTLTYALCALAAAAEGPWVRHTIDASSRGADGVRLADVNGDLRPDIATAWEEGGVTRVYVHPGEAAVRDPWPMVTVGRVAQPEDAVFADLDHDGALDVVTCCEGDEQAVYVHWAPATPEDYMDEGAWRTEVFPATQGVARWMFALPFDRADGGDTDLVLGAKNPGGGVGWLICPETPRDTKAWQWVRAYTGEWIMSIQKHDIDGDGRADVLFSERRGPQRGIFGMWNAAGSASWHVRRIGPADTAEWMFLWGGRAKPEAPFEIVACAKEPRKLFHITRDGEDWTFRDGTVPEDAGTPKGVAVADLDNDGAREIVLSCEHAFGKPGLMAFRLADFSLAWDMGGREGIKFDRIELADLDGDGDLDVLTCEETRGLGVIWYENPCW